MKVAVKKQIGKQWTAVPAREFVGKSIADWLLETKEVAMACLYDEQDKPQVFITNSSHWAEQYRDKGFTMTVQEFKDLAGATVVPAVVVETFPDADFVNVTQEKIL